MEEDQVKGNLKGMDELDFVGWNSADWNGVFAHHHAKDVVVDWKGQAPTHVVDQHIDAMKAYVESAGGTPPQSCGHRRQQLFRANGTVRLSSTPAWWRPRG